MNKLLDGNYPFGRRCKAALTHPVTIVALCLLLLNDLLFKSLWSNPWITGKLSDLTWVVFASPLLAFLLSPAARRSPLAERIAFATAYAGLPLLYAAFNTFPVVHDAILWALSFAGGTGPGAPLDPTDSLVIPFGLAITFWVWRREPPESNSLRMRFGLLTAGIAALASVATSPPKTDFGVTAVEVEPDGTIVRAGGKPTGRSVETPRGTYTIKGPYIMRTQNGERTVAYSAAYLQEDGNIKMQTRATRGFRRRAITTEPYSIMYDDRSGNVVVAMGLQGAVVGTPNGQWERVAVGRYVPTDFSIVSKLLLLRDWELWLSALALAFSFIGLAMVLAEAGTSNKVKPRVLIGWNSWRYYFQYCNHHFLNCVDSEYSNPRLFTWAGIVGPSLIEVYFLLRLYQTMAQDRASDRFYLRYHHVCCRYTFPMSARMTTTSASAIMVSPRYCRYPNRQLDYSSQ